MKTALATVTISGTLKEKLEAAAAAGFDGVEIFENDLTQYERSPREVRKMADDLGLEIIALQPFRDMEGMPERLRQQKREMLKRKMEVAHELGTSRLLMCSNVQSYASGDRDQCAADLRFLAEMAEKEGMTLGYEALAWGYHIADYMDAWDLVKRTDHPNLGINLDTFHMYSRGNTLDCLRDEIPVDKIALVQIADAPIMPRQDYLTYSRHSRCFPGQGDMPVVEFLQVLKDKGFDDYLSHEIFNDEFRSSSPIAKAIDGMRSLIWLDDQTVSKEETKTQPVTVPDVKDIEFIEFAVEGESGEELIKTLAQLGFHETHKHVSKNVSLMRQGNINLILNREPASQAHEHFQKHGVSVCALGFLTENVKETLRMAERYRAERFANQAGPGELNIPAIRGIGDSLVYLVGANSRYRFFDVDFVEIEGIKGEQGVGLTRVDHVGQTVSNVDFLSAGFFYKSIFGFEIEPRQDLPDIHGLVVSRTATNKDKSVRIPINMTNARDASAERFMKKAGGSGVHQIAFACKDIFAAVKNMDQEKQLPIPDNYYRDLEARLGLEPALVKKLKEHNIMYDENEAGAFFHCYTEEICGVFFEVVQRVEGYNNYGESNAYVRLASQARQELK
ncbi:bifunctional sugar phosphate isomerase/epimerase/4-hydroxyphenylpyruvate dioxygenase family protein [Marinomonas fungiae]|uniref:3-dehydroshikimate dehydratase n=1 Tax=Marinomonas fungiae TaxID=1137284 RepID=A0A0K6IKB6_9GAMM|nr:sugar phosphate isomerase/epimerase and 4-hydroxyphenylpyruvate domain-containing protein [Marinomonas fungiae]CUB03549.1 4-hydroxyphenylpyruvate dioxygenase and related hemolysins [Marinomonas fungiae]